MTSTDLRLTVDQENALREATETGRWYPLSMADWKVAAYLQRRGLFAHTLVGSGSRLRFTPGYRLTAAGRDWLATRPEATR
jgi:hypothetical protein